MRTIAVYLSCFLAPLVFFTDLTRNPFCFQALVLSLCLIVSAICIFAKAIREERTAFPFTVVDASLLFFAITALVSFVSSYFGHSPFFRPAILNFARKETLFLVSACIPAFYLAVRQYSTFIPEEIQGKNGVSQVTGEAACKRYVIFIALWLFLWLFYPYLKVNIAIGSLFGRIFDVYGTFLFVLSFIAIRPTIRHGSREEIFRLVMAAAMISSLYGIFQFFGGEIIWDKTLNPYGNRPVSTFGNPNFLSAFVAMLLPMSFYKLRFSDGKFERIFYGAAIFSYTGVLLCSMARSSWIGAVFGLFFLFLFMKKAKLPFFGQKKRFFKFFCVSLLLFILFFPSGSGNMRPLSLYRAADLFSGLAVSTGQSVVSGSDIQKKSEIKAYGSQKINISVYQRLMMWATAWQIGLENPFLGNGFGQFELFASVFQGRLLASFPDFRDLRTHANEAHNEILQKWADLGISGLAAVFLIFAIFVRQFRIKMTDSVGNSDTVLADDDGNSRNFLFVPLAAGLLAMCVDNMANVSLHFIVPAALFWYMAGAFVAETGGSAFISFSGKTCINRIMLFLHIAILLVLAWAAVAQIRIFLRETAYFAGYKAFRQAQPLAAAKMLEQAMRYDSSDVNTAYETGNVLLTVSDYQKGEAYLEKALNANAGYDEIYYNLAASMSKRGLYAEALPYIQTATVINPFSQSSWNLLGRIYSQLPPVSYNVDSAIRDFDEAERFFPENADYPNIKGYMLIQAGRHAGAASVLAKAVHSRPGNRTLCENFLLANSTVHTENETEAWLKEYYRLVSLLGSFLDNEPEEKTLKSYNDLEKLIQENPDDIALNELKGKYLFKLKRYGEAAKAMQSVLERFPRDADVRYGLAVIYEADGKYWQANAELDAILGMNPKYSRAARKREKIEQFLQK